MTIDHKLQDNVDRQTTVISIENPQTTIPGEDEDNVSYTESEKVVHSKQWEQSNIEELLRSWGEKAGGLRWMHVYSATHWRFVDARMNYIGITLSSVISASSLTGIAESFIPQHYVMLFVGIVGMLNMFAQSLQRYYRSSEKAAMHESAAKQFGNFNRYVATKLSLSRSERGPPKQVLDFALRENERLHKETPDPYFRSIDAFKIEFGSRANNLEFSIPDFVTDTFKLHMYNEQCDNMINLPIRKDPSVDIRMHNAVDVRMQNAWQRLFKRNKDVQTQSEEMPTLTI